MSPNTATISGTGSCDHLAHITPKHRQPHRRGVGTFACRPAELAATPEQGKLHLLISHRCEKRWIIPPRSVGGPSLGVGLALALAAAVRIAPNAKLRHGDGPILPPPMFATRHITPLREENSRALLNV
jgi:hypothetical protein